MAWKLRERPDESLVARSLTKSSSVPETRRAIERLILGLDKSARSDLVNALAAPAQEAKKPTEPTAEPDKVQWVDLLSAEFLAEFRARQMMPVSATPTPFPAWSEACGDDGGGIGLPDGWLVIVGGNSGKGKTNLTLQMVLGALHKKGTAAYVSLEMSHRSLAQRFFSMASGARIKDLERGRFNDETFDGVIESLSSRFPEAKLWTNKGTIHETPKVIAQMMRLMQRGVTVFFIDYLQLIGLGDEETINMQVGESISYLKEFVSETGALVVCISQLNRTASANIYDSPTIHALMGGGVIEQAADQVLLLDHSRYERLEDGSGARTWLILGKNRFGSELQFPVYWNFKNLTAREAMQDEVDSWPTHKERKAR